MIIFPDLVPFNFIKNVTINYRTTFPNKDNTQKERRSSNPTWHQVFPYNVGNFFIVWLDDSESTLAVTSDSSISASTNYIGEYNDYYAYAVYVKFLESGTVFLNITDGTNSYTSNTFEVKDSLYDEVTEYHVIEYSHFRNSFDYFFDYTFKFWVESNSIIPSSSSDIESYEGDENNTEVTYSTANDSIEITIPAVDRWFARFLNHVSVCSSIKVDNIEYSPTSAASIEQTEDFINRFDVTLTLKEKI